MKLSGGGMMGMLLIFIFLFCELCNGLKNPGLKTRITQKGLTYATEVAIQQLSKNVVHQEIPDQSGSSSGFHFELSRMNIKSFTSPQSSVTVSPGNGLVWRANGLGIRMSPQLYYSKHILFAKLSDRVNFDVKLRDLRFSIGFTIGRNGQGRPDIHAGGCSCDIGSVDVNFHGNLAFVYNLLHGPAEDAIKKQLRDKMCTTLKSLINNNARKSLAKSKVMTTMGDSYLLDYSLISSPLYKDNYMETYHKGEVYWNGNMQEAPIVAPPMPNFQKSDKMFYIWMSDYVFNTMSYTSYKHGLLTYSFTRKDMPSDNPYLKDFLNTSSTCSGSCLGLFIPELAKRYPGTDVELLLETSEEPRMSITNGSIVVNSVGDITMNVKLPNGKKVYVMTITAKMVTVVSVFLKNEMVYAEVADLKIKIHVTKSSIGAVKDFGLQILFSRIIAPFVKGKLNDVGKQGLPLPVNGDVHFTNTQLILEQDALLIATDLRYG